MDGGRPPLGGAEDDAVGTAAPRARSSPQAAKEAVISLVLGQAGGVERDALVALKLPELVRRALAAGVDGDLLGDAMRLRHAPPTGGAEDPGEAEAEAQAEAPPVRCEFCGADVPALWLADHQEICPEMVVGCINEQWGCTATMPRRLRGAHLQLCPASVVVCHGRPTHTPQRTAERWHERDNGGAVAEERCRWLGEPICGQVVRRDQWEQHVILSHELMPIERSTHQLDAGSRPGDEGWYRVDWATLWGWLAECGWTELSSVKWWGNRSTIYLRPGVVKQ